MRAIVADCVGLFFWGGNMVEEFAKMSIRLGQWSERNFWRAINAQVQYYFVKTPWGTSP